jgi:ClpP class serine protease
LGVEAKEFGLIDGFGGLDEAKKKAEELSGIEDLKEVSYEKKKGLMDYFAGAGLKGFYGIGRGIGDSFSAVGVRGEGLIPKV